MNDRAIPLALMHPCVRQLIHPRSIRSIGTGRLIAGKLLLVAALALAVTEVSLVARLDVAMTETVHGWTMGWLTQLVLGISGLASTEVIIPLTVAAAVALAVLEHWRGAFALALSVLATQAVVALAKALVSRPRPDDGMAVVDPSGASFPSAHSASAVALYVMLALIAATAWRGQRRLAGVLAAGSVVVLVGLSRVYLGAHYPTDVLAGWLVGGILVVGSWALCSRLPAPSAGPAAA